MAVLKMRKVCLVARVCDEESIMQTLQECGLMHILPINTPREALDIQEAECQNYLENLFFALRLIKQFKAGIKDIPPDESDVSKVVEKIVSLANTHKTLTKSIELLEQNIKTYQNFGAFNGDLTILTKLNLTLKLAILNEADFLQVKNSNITYEIVHKENDQIFLAFFLKPKEEINVSSFDPPLKPLLHFKKDLDDKVVELKKIEAQLSKWSYKTLVLENFLEKEQERFERIKETKKAYQKDNLFGLSGFILKSSEEDFRQAMAKHVAAFLIEKPDVHDDIPVLLKNPSFIKSFEHLIKIFSGFSYFEKDKTFIVSILFMLFGSLCLLDAGYGVLLMLLGYVLAVKYKNELGAVFVCTGFIASILGILCGQIFGLVFDKDIFFNIKPIFELAENPMLTFKFSLGVGIFTMLLCNFVVVAQKGVKNTSLGNIFIILSAIAFIANKAGITLPTMDENLEFIFTWLPFSLLLAAAIFWLIFPDYIFGKEKRIANRVWTFYSGPVGIIQDILSHMRLFGIALAGSILALVINKIASMMPFALASIFGPLAHFCIFFLALLSLYIHTNRLIFLEFGSKCMLGGNNYFKPFLRRHL